MRDRYRTGLFGGRLARALRQGALTLNIRLASKPSAAIGHGFSSDTAPWLTDENVPVVMLFLVFAGLA